MKFILKFSSLFAFVMAVLSGATLFWVSQQVQELEREQRQISSVIDQEQEATRVLSAEWDYLNRPDRLEDLARTYLNMEPMKVESAIASVNDIPMPEEPPAEPMLAGSDGEKIDKTPEPQMVTESVSPTLNEAKPAQELDFNGVLDNNTESGTGQ